MSFKIPLFQPGKSVEALSAFINEVFRRWSGSDLLNVQELDLPSWDMTSTSSVNVTYSTDVGFKRVVGADVTIVSDDESTRYFASLIDGGLTSVEIDATDVTLTRKSGGFFDTAEFNDSTLSSRGKLILRYTT